MVLSIIRTSLAVLAITLATAAGGSAQEERPGVYVIYDSSNSMWGALPDTTRKYEAARSAMRDLVARDFGGRDIALRMYGHRRKDDCTDSALVVPFGPQADNAAAMIAAMDAVRPIGRTPIDRSLRAALEDFGDRPGTIILISDGIESCDADPCALVQSWRDRDIDITLHVVGLGLSGKERAGMECIAEAAGTDYLDAATAGELAASLDVAASSGAPDPGTPDPAPQAQVPDVALEVRTPDGELRRGAGFLTPIGGGEPIRLDTNTRHVIDAGRYSFTGGVVVVGGGIYRPQTVEVELGTEGRTVVAIEAPMPPRASARFEMDGVELSQTVVTVFRDGEKLGSFHGNEVGLVPEGRLSFRTRPRATSQTLIVEESFAAGDIKEIAFVADREVELVVHMVFQSTGTRLLAQPSIKLLQDGAEVDKINRGSGGLVRPGTYVVQGDDRLNRFEAELEVTGEAQQHYTFEVPSGTLVVSYLDADGAREAPKRIFLRRAEARRGVVRRSDEPVPVMPGNYVLEGHPKAAAYPETPITIVAGQTLEITLQAGK